MTQGTQASKQQPESKQNVRLELDQLDANLTELKVRYEQYFVGTLPLPPDKQYAEVVAQIKRLRKAPFRNSEMKFRLKGLEHRFNTLNTYWQRVIREREEGTYSRDVFKAALRERAMQEEAHATTVKGQAEKGLQNLFNSYRSAVEKQTGRKQDLDFELFRTSIVKRVKDLKEQHGNSAKVTFKVVVKEGKVSVQASAKRPESSS